MAQIVTITNPLTGQPAQVDQLEHTAQQIDDSIGRALPGGEIDTLLAGKAPAGYGLGSAFNSASDANTIVAFGCYSTKVNTPTGDWCTILHIPYGENNATQYAKIGEGYDYQRKCAAKRDKIKGTWQPWEWVNPPMLLGEEYRTTEMYKGKPVYALCGEFGSNINGASAYFGENVDKIVRGFVLPSGGNNLTPSWNGNSIGVWTVFYDFDVATDPSDSVRKIKVTCRAGSSASGGYGSNTVNLYYTKNTN